MINYSILGHSEAMTTFPISLKAKAPPIKSQGIKTKLVPFILSSIQWDGKGRWIEPFLGSGSVLLNAKPDRALVADTNKHIINVYKYIQSEIINANSLKYHLETEGCRLEKRGEDYYYEVRNRFNNSANPFDFIFLNRASFNGVVRFNSKGGFNVPFCKKIGRFRAAYVTKICNQVAWAGEIISGRNWIFEVRDWRDILDKAEREDFVYLDPPYTGRHADYYSQWKESDASELAERVKNLPCGFAYSMWKKNVYRENEHLNVHFQGFPCLTYQHFYQVGSREDFRNAMEEALIISPISLPENIQELNSS
ncbi:MAG: hypothetical protein N5P05_000830 [Chroococcopsis gigantea SAG 12.99]|jgi:DNA adenine methylase|nr:Dam family site-specific DNA-(adenine-N6)-methyltransferase [Chlorogloea purpurea SAG 13.99]MDV2999224.1 hypothetical protein [Chroococcopsis gigantea SAG 12.99]